MRLLTTNTPLSSSLIQHQTPSSRAMTAKIIAQLQRWARESKHFIEPLADCAEEIACEANITADEIAQYDRTVKFTGGAKQIITTLKLWAELYSEYQRVLSACAEEIQIAEARRAPKRLRPRDEVLNALIAGYQTVADISAYTGLPENRTWRHLRRMMDMEIVERRCACVSAYRSDYGAEIVSLRKHIYQLTPYRP